MAENYWYSSLSADEIEATLLNSVRGDVAQEKSTSWKAQARANIGAGSENTGFQILGYYLTLEEMKESLQVPPQAGDAYGIAVFRLTTDTAPEAGITYYTRTGSGTAEDPYTYTLFEGSSFETGVDYYVIAYYDTYVYDGASQDWLDIGPINEGEFIDDSEISPILTWSSQKIKNELDAIDLSELIDDSDTAADTTWSSQKIDAEITAEITAVTALHLSGTVTAFPFTISNAAITATMRIAECTWGTPSAVQSDVTWTTAAGSIELDGTLASGGSTTVDLILVETRGA